MTIGVHNLAWQSWFDSHAVSRSVSPGYGVPDTPVACG